MEKIQQSTDKCWLVNMLVGFSPKDLMRNPAWTTIDFEKASKLISTSWMYQTNQIEVYFGISNYEADKTIVLN